MNQREHERYIVEFPARFAGDYEGLGIVYNLSLGGCKIVTDRPLTIGGMLALSLQVPIGECQSRFGWRQYGGCSPYEFGMKFLGIEELERERLAAYLHNLAQAAA